MEKIKFFSTALFSHLIWLALIGGSALFWWTRKAQFEHKNELAVFWMQKVLRLQKDYFQGIPHDAQRSFAYPACPELVQTANECIDSFQTQLALFEKGNSNTAVLDLILLWDSFSRNAPQICPKSDQNNALNNANLNFPTTVELIELSDKNDFYQNLLLLKNLKFQLVNLYSELLKQEVVQCEDPPTALCLSAAYNPKDPKYIEIYPLGYRTFTDLATPAILLINGDTIPVRNGLGRKQFICKIRGEIPVDVRWFFSDRCSSPGDYQSCRKLFSIMVE